MRSLLTADTAAPELTDEALAEAYAYPSTAERTLDRPWVRANFVASLDGAVQGPDHRSGSLSGSADRRVLALLRALSDVILVGAGTARAETYGPATIRERFAPLRVARQLPPTPPIAVVTASLQVPDALLTDPRTVVVTTQAADAERRRGLAERVDLVTAGTDSVDLAAALVALAARGHRNVVCEGGPTLIAELAARDLLDELCLTVAPVLTAGGGLRVAQGPALVPPLGFAPVMMAEQDGFLFGRWLRER